MEKPKNLFYRTNNVSRSILDEVIGDMDKIAELPPREGMDFEDPNFSREVEYGDASAHNEGLNMSLRWKSKAIKLNNEIGGYLKKYLVKDIHLGNPNGKEKVVYTCYFGEGDKIKHIEDGVHPYY